MKRTKDNMKAMKSKYLRLAAVGFAASLALTACQEHIDEGARYTFVGNTIATYLQGTEDCSHFVEILTRGEQIGLMKAYGQYTCFAPTNAAVERFLIEQDSIYWASVEENKKDPSKLIIETGVTSPNLADLSAGKCREIARNHILSALYLGTDMTGSLIPHATISGRDLVLAMDSVTGRYLIDGEAPVIDEAEVENGIVHIVGGVVNPTSLSVSGVLDGYGYFTIFNEAFKKTGFAEMLMEKEDPTYTDGDKIAESIRAKEYAPYPKERLKGFTVFIEPDTVLKKKLTLEEGKTPFEALVAYCQELYPVGTDVWVRDEKGEWKLEKIEAFDPEDEDAYKDWHNPVKQFIAYHIIDRKVAYKNLVCFKYSVKGTGAAAGYGFDSEKDFPSGAERVEYYVTMNNRILKATMPRGKELSEDIFLNYTTVPVGEDKGANVLVYAPADFKKLDSERYADYKPEASNGSINVLSDVLYYDGEIMKTVLDGIMRFDVASICSELTNNGIRWEYASDKTSDGSVFIPHTYCERLQVYTDNTRLYYLAPHTNWHNYQGDEMMAQGIFDFAYLLPPVPEGTYEIRLGYSASEYRGIAQVYLDNEVTGIPIDLRLTGENELIGWRPDGTKEEKFNNVTMQPLNNDEEEIAKNDKEMKNRGYLKGPTSFNDDESNRARDDFRCLRVVIAKKYLTEGAHWLRFKNVNVQDPEQAQFMHDYIEIVPTSYLNREDISLEEKRK